MLYVQQATPVMLLVHTQSQVLSSEDCDNPSEVTIVCVCVCVCARVCTCACAYACVTWLKIFQKFLEEGGSTRCTVLETLFQDEHLVLPKFGFSNW